jgi:choline kinase
MRNIIIQAGGRGSRLEFLTVNKPKCLVSIDNLPVIFTIAILQKFQKHLIQQ